MKKDRDANRVGKACVACPASLVCLGGFPSYIQACSCGRTVVTVLHVEDGFAQSRFDEHISAMPPNACPKLKNKHGAHAQRVYFCVFCRPVDRVPKLEE